MRNFMLSRQSWLYCLAVTLWSISVYSWADCIGNQTNCNSQCILSRRGDMGCINRCSAAAQACIQAEYNKPDATRRRNAESDSDSDRDADEAGPEEDSTNAGSNNSYPSAPAPARPHSGDTRYANRFDSHDVSHCYETFYDRNAYNWLAIRNKCSEPIHVTWRCQTCGERLGSSASIAPGRSVNTGLSADDITRKGGLSYASCRDGYRAVGESGDAEWRANAMYRCRKI